MKRGARDTSGLMVGVAVCQAAIDTATGEIQLTPVGEFRSHDGRPTEVDFWRIDAATAARAIARTAVRTDDLVIDYEHQTLHTKANGKPAPAAGWFNARGLEWREGFGLFATGVRWTERAREMIAADEYRFISPVFLYHPKTGEVLRVLHAALTNDPAVDGMAEVAALAAARFSLQLEQEDGMNEELLELLGLKAGASEDDIKAAITALKAKADGAAGLEAKVAELTTRAEGAEGQVAALKAASGAPDPAKYVPVEAMAALQSEVAELKAGHLEREVDELVTAALKEGKLLPATEKWARDLGKSNLAALKAYLDKAVPVAALKGTQTGGKAPEGDGPGAITEVAMAVCTQLGVDPDEFKKTQEGLAVGA